MESELEVERLKSVYRQYNTAVSCEAQWSNDNRGNRAILRERTRLLGRLLHSAGLVPLTGRRVLDVGCGAGNVLVGLCRWGASLSDLHGIDLRPDAIERGRHRYPGVDLRVANAEVLPFADAQFDLVLLFTVFTSILDERMARNVADEVRRVLMPGGVIAWYDLRRNNPRNRNVRGMNRAAIQVLFPNFTCRLHAVTLLPPLARRLGPATPLLYPALAAVPPLRTHYLGLLTKPA